MRRPPRITDIRAEWLFPPDRLTVVGELTFAIPHRLPNLNDFGDWKASRDKGMWNRHKIAYEKAVRLAWVLTSIRAGNRGLVVRGAYKVRYLLLLKDKRSDPSNLFAGAEKVVLDGLQACGAIEGDGCKHHKGSEFGWEASDRWGVVVTVSSL